MDLVHCVCMCVFSNRNYQGHYELEGAGQTGGVGTERGRTGDIVNTVYSYKNSKKTKKNNTRRGHI